MRHILLAVAVAACCAAQEHPALGIGGKISTLGIGVEAATSVTRRSNVRVGFNAFSYSRDVFKDGIQYNGTATIRSLTATYDQYLKGGFHISPGVLLYNGNHAEADASVGGGAIFHLGGTGLMSDLANPVSGTGTVDLRKVSPMILAGFGNLLPRSARHFTVNVEFGVVFQGAPDTKLKLNGAACNASGSSCVNAGSNAIVQALIPAEEARLNDSLSWLKYYPIVSIGFGYKF